MKETKKARELEYLQRFREIFANFPEGEVVASEHPDFLIKTQSRWIGIELTEYHVQEPNEGWGSPMRTREGREDKILRTGSERHQSKGLPPVVVHVYWNSHQVFSSLRVQELATGEKPAPGDVSLPEDTKERVTEWAEGEDAKVRERKGLVEELSQAMKARGYDPTPVRQVMGG